MLVLFTDFSLRDPYVGQMQAVLHRLAPGIPLVNLFSDLPDFNPRAAAYLLPAYLEEFPSGTVFVCVVDPGVGSQRLPIMLEADGRWFVAPDNGLLSMVCKRAREVQCWQITWQPPQLSNSFHGRDLFAPVAANLAMGRDVPAEVLPQDALLTAWPEDLLEIIYIDHYGNAITGLRASQLAKTCRIRIGNSICEYVRVFSEAKSGRPFWYENANGMVEIATREASTASLLKLRVGDPISILEHSSRD